MKYICLEKRITTKLINLYPFNWILTREVSMEKVSLNGVNVFPFTSEQELLDYVEGHKGILVAINAEKILHATEQTRDIINRNIGYCDGQGAVRAMHQMGYENVVKIAGCELWLKIIGMTYKRGFKYYLVGGRPKIIEATVAKLKNEFDGIKIVGFRDGYIKSEKEKEILIHDVMAKDPEVVFVAMGSPKQELLMEEMLAHHVAIYQGLGGSFDVYTGDVERAPHWWVNHGLEWAYRMIKEPKRIKRQIHLLKFEWWLRSGKFKSMIKLYKINK